MNLTFVHRLAALGVILSLIGCSHTGLLKPERAGIDAIRAEDARADITYLASDAMKGRNTPSPELDTAAAFIARQFQADGLAQVAGSYFERVHLRVTGLGDPNSLVITVKGTSKACEIKSEFTPFDLTADGIASGAVVFAGYGITAPEYSYDDYAGIDVKGKIVFVLRHEPGEEDSASIFTGRKPTAYSSLETKVRIAIEHGAVGMLVATDPLNHEILSPRGFPWPSLSRNIPKDALPLTIVDDDAKRIPLVHVGQEVMAMFFGSVDSLRNLQKRIDASVHPLSGEIPNARAEVRTSLVPMDRSSQNVVGYLEGSDPNRKGEIVVVGAHYDHVGYTKVHAPNADSIYNGADDNASGTTGLLGIARAFGHAGVRPARSVLFIAFCGEEKGLFGSEYYARHPLFPLDSTVAMINMDMIGRNAPDSLYLIAESFAPRLGAVCREANEAIGFTLVDDEHEAGGSDHMSFRTRKIPALFLHSGLHPQYHQLTDEVYLIDADKIARVARLGFLTAWRVANGVAAH